MKKLIFVLAALMVVLILPMSARAETFDGVDYEYTFTTTNASAYINEELKIYSHYPFAFVRESSNGNRLHLVTIVDVENQYYTGKGLANLTAVRNTTDGTANVVWNSDGQTTYSQTIPITKASGGSPTYGWSIMLDPTPYTDTEIYDTYEDAYEALTYVDPTYYFDSTLSSPDFKIFILELPDFLGLPSDETNYFGINFANIDSRYKLEVFYRYICPDEIQIGLSNGKITYQPLQYDTSNWNYAYRDFAISVNDNLESDDFTWISPVNPDIEFFTNVPSWQSNPNNSAYVNAQNNWNDHYKYCMPLYGNKIEICARYFYEDGSDIYVGPWTQWINTYPNIYNEQVPANYVNADYIPGVQGVDNNTNLPTDVIQSGEVTGPVTTTSVTINQNTPNYPDYPTAASYNHDNVLLQWIQTSLKLPGMIGQFSAFLTSAFTFIPSSFWTIVGFGLMCCIAIMIIKVL